MESQTELLGPNGAGISSLLKLLLGKIQPQEGEERRSGKLRLGYFFLYHVETILSWRTPLKHMKGTFPYGLLPELRIHIA